MYTETKRSIPGRINTKPGKRQRMREPDINKIQEELELIKKKLRISEQDVFRLAAEKIDLQDTIKKLNQNNEDA
jgi:hypothetical protein